MHTYYRSRSRRTQTVAAWLIAGAFVAAGIVALVLFEAWLIRIVVAAMFDKALTLGQSIAAAFVLSSIGGVGRAASK